jgi:hypothetical protein
LLASTPAEPVERDGRIFQLRRLLGPQALPAPNGRPIRPRVHGAEWIA